jgi:hypothetical protein
MRSIENKRASQSVEGMRCCLLCSSEGHRGPDGLDSVLHQDLLMPVDESWMHSNER